MTLKLHACLLSLPLLVVNAERYQVMHSSGRRRREARLAKHALATTKQVEVRTVFGEREGCREQGRHCILDGNCCGDMECLGLVNWECGNTPGHEDEYCNLMYPCDPDLMCFEDKCTDYADILDRGDKRGDVREGESAWPTDGHDVQHVPAQLCHWPGPWHGYPLSAHRYANRTHR